MSIWEWYAIGASSLALAVAGICLWFCIRVVLSGGIAEWQRVKAFDEGYKAKAKETRRPRTPEDAMRWEIRR